jgi:hypothetical protein
LCTHDVLNILSVLDRVIQSKLARSTRLPGFNSNVKIYFTVYIILVLFVLLLLVMRIWVDLHTLDIWDFGSTLKYRQAKPARGKPAMASLFNMAEGGC